MESVTKSTLFKQSPAEAKGDATTRAARAIMDQEREKRDAKTARLKAARLAKEAEDAQAEALAAPAPAKAKAVTATKPKSPAKPKARRAAGAAA